MQRRREYSPDDHSQKTHADSGETPTSPEICQRLRSRLEATAEDEDQAPEDDGVATSEPIARGTGEEGSEEGTAREEADHDSAVQDVTNPLAKTCSVSQRDGGIGQRSIKSTYHN